MVDGKGGNLKTIHHYKTERLSCTTLPFRLFIDEYLNHPPMVQIHNALPAGSLRKKKGRTLVSAALLFRLFRTISRSHVRSVASVRGYEKIILLNPVRIEVCLSPLTALRILLPRFSFHTMVRAYFLSAGSRIKARCKIPPNPVAVHPTLIVLPVAYSLSLAIAMPIPLISPLFTIPQQKQHQ
jgi:hypothetical protein